MKHTTRRLRLGMVTPVVATALIMASLPVWADGMPGAKPSARRGARNNDVSVDYSVLNSLTKTPALLIPGNAPLSNSGPIILHPPTGVAPTLIPPRGLKITTVKLRPPPGVRVAEAKPPVEKKIQMANVEPPAKTLAPATPAPAVKPASPPAKVEATPAPAARPAETKTAALPPPAPAPAPKPVTPPVAAAPTPAPAKVAPPAATPAPPPPPKVATAPQAVTPPPAPPVVKPATPPVAAAAPTPPTAPSAGAPRSLLPPPAAEVKAPEPKAEPLKAETPKPETKVAVLAPPPPAPVAKVEPAKPTETQTASLPPPKATPQPDTLTISFAVGVPDVPNDADGSLKSLAARLKADGALRVQLLAFASDPEKSVSRSRRLSLERAVNVRKQLLSAGIDSTRIEVRALGEQAGDGAPDRVDAITSRR